ncbi:ComF family protein [Saccharicrinis carchari]|nr:phosphoribosyltransferase family protein [Saccharicrinis carchari]
MRCTKNLPRSYFHLADDNPLNKLFWGRVDIEKVVSFLLYTSGSHVKEILHALKYGNRKELGYELGKLYAKELSDINYFGQIDFLVPVPLHPKKKSKRGYNQSEWIAKGLAEHLPGKVMVDNLYKKLHTTSQTNKGRYSRWENIAQSFDIRDTGIFKNKKVLLVDDVLTTGATIEACAGNLAAIEGITIYVATLAYACD